MRDVCVGGGGVEVGGVCEGGRQWGWERSRDAVMLFFPQMLEEVRAVGSIKTATNLAGHSTADVVVLLKSIPTGRLHTL